MGGSVISLYSEVKTTPVKWLWYPFIAVGKISLLQGDPGDGKSTMMLRLIAPSVASAYLILIGKRDLKPITSLRKESLQLSIVRLTDWLILFGERS